MTPNESSGGVDWIEVDRLLTTPPIEEEPTDWNACRHLQVGLDDQAHTVTCRTCQKVLDPFWYLQLLAKEWGLRQYRFLQEKQYADTVLRAEEERKAKYLASHSYRQRPTRKGSAQETWDRASKLLGQDPPAIFAMGRNWYVASPGNGHLSMDWLEEIGHEKARIAVFGSGVPNV